MGEEPSVLSILKGMIGHEETYTDEFEIEKGMCKRFAVATGDPNPIYHDEDFAKSTPQGGILAPPTLLFEWNHHKHGALPAETRESIFKGLALQPRLLRGMNEYHIDQPVRPGDIIKSKAKIKDVYEKQGRSGQLIFMICETEYFNQNEEKLGKCIDTYIFLP
jgi:acyl dehydratase